MNRATNNQMLNNVNTDHILAETLSNFNTSYIIDVVRNSIDMKFRPYSTPMPSLNSIEMNFQTMLSNFNDRDQQNQILEVRRRTYDEIIDVICKYYNLTYTPMEDIDNYSVAYYLYNVLVAQFYDTMVKFFVNYIVDHQDEIISTLKVPDTKDTYDAYSKKLYGANAIKLGRIHGQINDVIMNITELDISLHDIIRYGSNDVGGISILEMTISEIDNVFRTRFAPYLSNISSRADIITAVKLNLQSYAQADINIIAPQKEEVAE